MLSPVMMSSSLSSSQDDTYINDRGVTSNESIHVRKCSYTEELCKKSMTKAELDVFRGAACEYAKVQYQADFASSHIIDSSEDFPKFAAHEIIRGNILGKGGFGVVYVVNGFEHNIDTISSKSNSQKGRPESITRIFEEKDDEDSTETTTTSTDLEIESRKFIAEHCYRKNGEDPRYAIKQLQPNVNTLFQGILDLNAETRFLSSLPHHCNIIKLRALSQGNPFDPDYFIVIDRLYDTLEERLQKWKLQRSKGSAIRYLKRRFSLENRTQMARRTQTQKAQLCHDRLWVAYDLSSALAHLHEHSIIHRDVKPDNIGFDIRGDVKIFDFGLAKEIPQDGKGPWKFTGMCGSPRYMAPEVALCQVYNESCDVYSFAMLFWEILTCKKPFVKISMDQLVTNVWDGAKYRPKLEANKWSPEILDLLNKAWSPDMSLRPTMKEIEATLQIQVVEGCGIEAKESKRLSHQTRRSTYVQSKQGSSTSRMVASWFDSSSSKSLY